MKENALNYENGTTFIFLERQKPARKKSRNPLLVLLVIGMAITGGACWWSDQVLTQTRAGRGDAEAQYSFGKRCFDRARTPQEREEAVGLIRKAAEQGNPKAQTGLGIMYLNAVGMPRDYAAGVKWLHAAASRNFAVAQNELGVMYATGLGMPRDLDAAILWCSKAVDNGSRIARKNLELIQAAKLNHCAGQVTTRNGDPCLNLKVQSVESDGVMVAFQPEKGGLGFAKLKRANLPQELQKLCGYTATAPSRLSALLHLDGFNSTL